MNAGPQQWREPTGATVVGQNDVASTLPSTSAGLTPATYRFAHFELEIDPYGKPVELGRGGMGVTYKALDLALRRPVALKVIAFSLRENEDLNIRFIREARAAAALRHPNVASVFHLGSTESSYFYAMEFVAGKTLEELIATQGPLSLKLALEIAAQLASALDAAHQAGLVHRDVKPANLIVDFDVKNYPTVKVIDFGLVQVTADVFDDDSVSDPGIFLGTPRYASPEQFAEGRADIRSDLYSLGVVLWEMLTKSTPFTGSVSQVAAQHQLAAPPISKLRHIPQPVVSLITHLLEKDPADRPQTPEEFLTLLRAAMRAFSAPKAVFPGELRLSCSEPALSCDATEAAIRCKTGRSGQGPPPDSWEITPFVVAKVKDFTGREWLFQEIEDWRAKGSTPALLIVGEPGIGKSSIVAALVHNNPRGQVLAYHCCRGDTPSTLEPAGFVRSLADMFSARLEGYAAMLEEAGVVKSFQRSDTDPVSALEAAIIRPLHRIRPPAAGRCYLLIDGLDEALTRTNRPTIVDVISTRLDHFPSWLRIVATTRRDPAVLNQLRSLPAHILSAQDPRNCEDVRRFIRNRLAEAALHDQAKASGKILKAIENDLLRSSAGNFLFVTTALDAVESGQLSFDQIENLPPGLSSLYEIFFHRLFRDADVDFGVSRQVLEAVAAARESLTREQIAAATGLDAEEELSPILSRLASFVPARDGRYAFFHKSFSDWLTGWDVCQDQPFAGQYHLNLRKGWIRLTNWCWAEYQRRCSNISSYCVQHLPAHLHQVGRDHDLSIVLSDFYFLQSKLKAGDGCALIADYDYLPEEADLRLVQSTLRLSTHAVARDHRQLAGQLTGRLLGNQSPNIRVLLSGAAECKDWPWLRPLTPSLAPPGGPLIRTFKGHTCWVHAVALTQDGQCAVSGSGDGTVRVWDLDGDRLARIFQGHTAPVRALALTPDGRRVVSASVDRTLRVWDLESGRSVYTLEGHNSPVVVVAITRENRRAISASSDGMLRVWDLESGRFVCKLEGHLGSVNAVAVTPDGHRGISASSDHTLRVWDLDSGQLLHTLEGHLDVVNDVAVTPDGNCAISASCDHTLRLWDLEGGRLVRTLEGHMDSVTAVEVTPDGRRAISGSADHSLRLWDLKRGQSLRTLEGHMNSVTSVVLMPGGSHIISGSPDHTLRLWDFRTGQSLGTFAGHSDWITSMAVTPDGRRAVSASADHTLRLWDLKRGQSVQPLTGRADSVSAVTFTPDGCRAGFLSEFNMLRMWDLDSGRLLRTFVGHADWVTAVAVMPEGHRVLSASADHTLRVWDLKNGQSLRKLEGHADLVSAVAVTLDGRRAISASADHTLRIWDLDSGKAVRTLESHADLVSAIAITPDGRCAVWGSDVGALLVWDQEFGETMHILPGHKDWVTSVAVAPNGEYAISASSGGAVIVWDLKNGQSVRTLEGHTDLVNALVMAPDGRRAISASDDHTLRVWDVESGNCISTFTGEGPVLLCAIDSDGLTVIARERSGLAHYLRLEELD